MKTKDQMLFFKIGLPVILFILSFFQELSAQNMPLMKSISPSPYSSSTMVENALKIGLGMIGSEAPGAKFHIKSDYSIPTFLAEGYTGGQVNRSVKNIFYTNGKYFGIYQTSTDDTYNYFKNSISIGENASFDYLLNVDGSAMLNDGLYIGNIDNPAQTLPFIRCMTRLDFIIDPSPKSGTGNILRLTSDYATVDGLLKTTAFQMETGAGAGKVLTSDAFGNGSWQNHVNDGDWIWPTGTQVMYSNNLIENVGIGTVRPTATLDVNGTLRCMNLGIGTDPPIYQEPDYKWRVLVEGGIKAREIKVTVDAFPDYVFEHDYSLLNLMELEQFVTTNKHLPGLPSSDDVKQDGGIEVGAMQVKLLEKIEEQSLYIISLQKQIDELKSMISSIKNTK